MRKSNDAIFDGVCGGIGEHFGIDPLWIRLMFVLGGWAFPYFILMLLMDEPKPEKKNGKAKSKSK